MRGEGRYGLASRKAQANVMWKQGFLKTCAFEREPSIMIMKLFVVEAAIELRSARKGREM